MSAIFQAKEGKTSANPKLQFRLSDCQTRGKKILFFLEPSKVGPSVLIAQVGKGLMG